MKNKKRQEDLRKRKVVDRYCNWVSENMFKAYILHFSVILVSLVTYFCWHTYWLWRFLK